MAPANFLVRWNFEWWIYVLNLTPVASILSYIYNLQVGIRTRIRIRNTDPDPQSSRIRIHNTASWGGLDGISGLRLLSIMPVPSLFQYLVAVNISQTQAVPFLLLLTNFRYFPTENEKEGRWPHETVLCIAPLNPRNRPSLEVSTDLSLDGWYSRSADPVHFFLIQNIPVLILWAGYNSFFLQNQLKMLSTRLKKKLLFKKKTHFCFQYLQISFKSKTGCISWRKSDWQD